MEETAFEWELTNYPLMQATVDKLNPFLNLYETSMEFMNKQKTWFESPMGTHDPKVILKTSSRKMSILCKYYIIHYSLRTLHICLHFVFQDIDGEVNSSWKLVSHLESEFCDIPSARELVVNVRYYMFI